jgi:hypothetical protein
MKIAFKRIWREKRCDLKNWVFYNVFIGLSPVLLSCFILSFGKVFYQFVNPFLDGTLLIFTATLSGASMNFYVTETKLNLRNTERYIFNGLLATIILGAGGYTAIIAYNQFSPNSLCYPIVFVATCAIMTLAIYFNLYLAGVRTVYTDAELMQRLITEEQDAIAKEKKALADTARAAHEVDGA